jgi:hypothetical protein
MTNTATNTAPTTLASTPPVLFLRAWQWWGMFAITTVSLSWVLQTLKVFTYVPNWHTVLPFLLSCLVLLVSFLTLVFDSYLKEKVKGNIQCPIGWFERLDAALNRSAQYQQQMAAYEATQIQIPLSRH